MKKVACYIVALALVAGLSGCVKEEQVSFTISGCCESCPVTRLDSVLGTIETIVQHNVQEDMTVSLTYQADNEQSLSNIINLINEHGYTVEMIADGKIQSISEARNCDLSACCKEDPIGVIEDPTIEDSLFEDLSLEVLEDIEKEMDEGLEDLEAEIDLTMDNEGMNIDALDDEMDALFDEDDLEKELNNLESSNSKPKKK